MSMKRAAVGIWLVALVAAPAATAWSWENTIVFDPLCIADYCPECPQPLADSIPEQECRKCIDRNMRAISFDSKTQTQKLDKAFVGLWRTNAGLTVAVKQNSLGFLGQVTHVPEKLKNHYPVAGATVVRARSSAGGKYHGALLAPNGTWIAADFTVSGKTMVSEHRGGKKVEWHKTIQVNYPDPSAMGRPGDTIR